MNTRLHEAATVMRGAVDRVRTWFNPPLDADARPLEVREAILDAIESRVEPAGGGRRVVSFNRVVVTIVPSSREHRALLEAALADLPAAVNLRLAELRCEVPSAFAVRVDYAKRPKAGRPSDEWLDIDFTRAIDAEASSPVAGQPVLHVTVVRGSASQPSYALSDRQILIGRTTDPVDQRGRTRCNQIAFLEDGDAAARTVGRAHASIRYEPARREYRLFDDGSHNGTRIVRDGAALELAPRDPIGIVLLSGDEIRFGTAAVHIRIE
jgi:hypothetical protein